MQEYLRQLKIYIKDIAKLALPITTAFVAMGLMGIIDTMIVGNYNTDQLAYIGLDRKSTRLNSSHKTESRMPSSA